MNRLWGVVATVAVAAVVVTAYLLDMGWFRVIGLLPALAELLLWGALAIATWSAKRQALWWATAACLVAFHALMPDFGDEGPAYAFFGLYRSTDSSEWLIPVAAVFGVVHLGLLAWLGIAWSNESRSAKDKSGTKS